MDWILLNKSADRSYVFLCALTRYILINEMSCISFSSLNKSITGRSVTFPSHQITSYLEHVEGLGFSAEENASAHAVNALIFLANLEKFIMVLGICSNLGCSP